MKPNERVIKKGDYYELETIEDLMMQQKLPKKDQPQSSSNIPIPNQNIITQLAPRAQALKNYQVAASAKIRTDDFGLSDYESSLQLLLKQPIRDQQRLQIQKLLHQIAVVKNNGQLPLNTLPIKKQQQKFDEAPKQIKLISDFNTERLQNNVKQLEDIKYIELNRLEQIVDILLNQPKTENAAQQNSTQIDDKTKQQIQIAYNNLNQLKCLNNLTGIVNKIASNQSKFIQMSGWTDTIQQANSVNKQILDQFQNDQMILKQLEQSFNKNAEAVRAIIKKLSE